MPRPWPWPFLVRLSSWCWFICYPVFPPLLPPSYYIVIRSSTCSNVNHIQGRPPPPLHISADLSKWLCSSAVDRQPVLLLFQWKGQAPDHWWLKGEGGVAKGCMCLPPFFWINMYVNLPFPSFLVMYPPPFMRPPSVHACITCTYSWYKGNLTQRSIYPYALPM